MFYHYSDYQLMQYGRFYYSPIAANVIGKLSSKLLIEEKYLQNKEMYKVN